LIVLLGWGGLGVYWWTQQLRLAQEAEEHEKRRPTEEETAKARGQFVTWHGWGEPSSGRYRSAPGTPTFGPEIEAKLDRTTDRWTVTGAVTYPGDFPNLDYRWYDWKVVLYHAPNGEWHEEGRGNMQLRRLKVEGALEGEELKKVGKSSDFPLERQTAKPLEDDGRWSGDAQLRGQPPQAGEWADLEVVVPTDGKYTAIVYLTKARENGIIQFSLDGKPLSKPFDGFEPGTAEQKKGPLRPPPQLPPVELGTVELKKGLHTLRVEVTGKNKKSVGYSWGLDCVVLKPAS
jgi:hypothetical protein